jgi:type I restriction enzyme, S subunit
VFTKLDAGVRSLEQTQALLKSYRRSVLKAAVEGELSREWREAHRGELEPASELLERILQESREKFSGKEYKEPASPNTANLPELPDEWVWSNLGELKVFSLYSPRYSSDAYAEAGILVLRTSDINESGKVDYASAPKLPLTEAELRKYKVDVGDLLVTRTGSLGTLAEFNDRHEAIPGAYLIQYRIAAPVITSWYIFHLLKSPAGQRALLGGGAGVGRPNLNAPTIDAIPIPLPPLEEQHFIIEEIETRLSIVDKLEATVEANLKQAGVLRQSILKRAFSGELVPRDPDDEPASMLLERIRAERQAAKPKAREGRKSNAMPLKSNHAQQRGLF